MACFPWLQTCDNPDKLPFDIELFDGVLYTQALDCNGRLEPGAACCGACNLLHSKAQNIA
jgi:hypothetical protein